MIDLPIITSWWYRKDIEKALHSIDDEKDLRVYCHIRLGKWLQMMYQIPKSVSATYNKHKAIQLYTHQWLPIELVYQH